MNSLKCLLLAAVPLTLAAPARPDSPAFSTSSETTIVESYSSPKAEAPRAFQPKKRLGQASSLREHEEFYLDLQRRMFAAQRKYEADNHK